MTWLILDLILILIVVVCFFRNYHRGFLSALLGIVAVVASLLLALWVSNKVAEPIYETFVRSKLIASVSQNIEDGGGSTIANITGSIGALLGGNEADIANGTADQIAAAAEKIVDGTMQNGIISAIRVVVLLIVYLLAFAILRWIEKSMRKVNKVPLVGGINKVAGGVLGLCIGGFYAILYVSVCALIINLSLNTLTWLNADIIAQTKLVSLLYPYNLVAVLLPAH